MDPQVIKPTVTATNATQTGSESDPEVEKRRRIDEALAKLSGKAVPAIESSPTRTQHSTTAVRQEPMLAGMPAKAHDSQVQVQQKKPAIIEKAIPKRAALKATNILKDGIARAEEVIAEAASLDEALAIVKKPINKNRPVSSGPMVAPTQADTYAPIAYQTAEIERQKAEEKSSAEAAAAAEARKYKPPEVTNIFLANKKEFIKYGVLWLVSAPSAVVVYSLLSKIFQNSLPPILNTFVLAILFMLALYALFGWIPLVILYIRKGRL